MVQQHGRPAAARRAWKRPERARAEGAGEAEEVVPKGHAHGPKGAPRDFLHLGEAARRIKSRRPVANASFFFCRGKRGAV